MTRLKFILIPAMVLASSVQAKDLGFRYQNGKCLNANGQEGLNPGYIGQCGDLRNTVINRFNFDQTDLSGAKFDDGDLQASTFRSAILTGGSFAGAVLAGADLSQASAHNTNFSRANFLNSIITGTDFQNNDFTSANMAGMQISNIKFPGGRFKGVLWSGTTLSHIDLSGADLTGAKMDSAQLKNCTLDGSHLTNVNLTQAFVSDTTFKAALMDGANLTGSNLRQSQFPAASLNKANLKSAILQKVDLSQAKVDGCDLRSAELKDAVVTNTSFKGSTYDKHTALPFSADEATTRGMVFIKLDCNSKFEVEYNGKCYYLDGSGGKCDTDYELAAEAALTDIAAMFVGKDYKSVVSDNCCILHSEEPTLGENWGFEQGCNTPGPFSKAPLPSGSGCTKQHNKQLQQLTLCQTKD